MRRINPETGLFFKWGETRNDGKIFAGYRTDYITKSTGYFKEDWIKPESFKKKVEYGRQRKVDNPTYWSEYNKTTKGRAKKLIKGAFLRAKKKQMPFNLEWQDIEKVLKEGKCQLTGLSFCFEQTVEFQNHPFAPSLDRINPKEGYLKSNTRVILHSLNAALNEYGPDHLIKIVDAMKENLHGTKTKL